MKKRLWAIALALVMLCALSAQAAGVLVLPDDLEVIEAEAFMGLKGIETLTVPDGVTNIGDGAFKNMSDLRTIEIPGSVTAIGSNILSGTAAAKLIVCPPGSAAMTYASQNSIDYQAGTTCRALLIGNEYPEFENDNDDNTERLNGPYNDIAGMGKALGGLSLRRFQTYERKECTYAQIDSAITSLLSGARDQDISLFYFSGHGTKGGYLYTSDKQGYTPAHLRQKLDAVKGRKVVIIDACYSGGLIQDAAVSKSGGDPLRDFERDFMAAFQGGNSGGDDAIAKAAFNPSDYFVLTACRADETSGSFKRTRDGVVTYYGIFTYGLCVGIGYDYVNQTTCSMKADADGDGAVSLPEALTYIQKVVDDSYSRLTNPPDQWQKTQMYPTNSRWFAPFRNIS